MTDKEKLYDLICQRTKSEKIHFPGMTNQVSSYFEDIDKISVLEEYAVDGRKDIEKKWKAYFNEDLPDIRIECVKAILKAMSGIQTENPDNGEVGGYKGTGIREFIYNF